MTDRKLRVLRAKLIGAYRRRDDLASRGLPTDDVAARITELQMTAPVGLIAEAAGLAEPSYQPAV